MFEDLPDNKERAYNYAIYLLGLKLRTEGEIKEKLRVKGYPILVIDEVVHQLAENRYLDDQRYAEVYLDNLKKYKTFGYYGIKKKLMEKRLPSEIIERVLEEGFGEEEERKIAKRFLIKQKETDKQKLAQKLKARGFRAKLIFRVMGF